MVSTRELSGGIEDIHTVTGPNALQNVSWSVPGSCQGVTHVFLHVFTTHGSAGSCRHQTWNHGMLFPSLVGALSRSPVNPFTSLRTMTSYSLVPALCTMGESLTGAEAYAIAHIHQHQYVESGLSLVCLAHS